MEVDRRLCRKALKGDQEYEEVMDKTITVVGSGVAYAAPDTVVINGEIAGTVGDYSEAVRESAEALSSLRKAIGDAGFDMDDLRTTGFSVDVVYRNGESGSPEFCGYRYAHGISITAEADGELLGRLLSAITSCKDAPEFRVRYTVRDQTAPMAVARQAAVKDARHRDRELALAAGVKLGDIISISYASQNGAIASPRARVMSAMAVDAMPLDVEFHDSVTIQWEII